MAKPSAGRPLTRCVGESGGDEVRVLGLEPLELVHQRVELGVGDLRLVEDVVALFVVANQSPEFCDAFGGIMTQMTSSYGLHWH